MGLPEACSPGPSSRRNDSESNRSKQRKQRTCRADAKTRTESQESRLAIATSSVEVHGFKEQLRTACNLHARDYDGICMKSLTTGFCIIALVLAGTCSSIAQDQPPAKEKPSLPTKIADAVIVRPLSFASTAIGSAFFVISLPVTALMKKNKPAARALVTHPAWATFQRPLGDMDAMAD